MSEERLGPRPTRRPPTPAGFPSRSHTAAALLSNARRCACWVASVNNSGNGWPYNCANCSNTTSVKARLSLCPDNRAVTKNDTIRTLGGGCNTNPDSRADLPVHARVATGRAPPRPIEGTVGQFGEIAVPLAHLFRRDPDDLFQVARPWHRAGRGGSGHVAVDGVGLYHRAVHRPGHYVATLGA